MTRKVFWENPYLSALNTKISSVDGNIVTVDSTIFYAMAGGQESDHGTIHDYPVLEARKDGLEIFYMLPDDHQLKPGDPVFMRIDWERRYKLMQLHFAAELILELTYRKFEGIEKIGAHISEDGSRIDFLWNDNLSPALPELKEEAQILIDADHTIISAYSDEATERRYWEIEGFARVACGGTHLKRTGEIGSLELKRKNIGGGKERMRIQC